MKDPARYFGSMDCLGRLTLICSSQGRTLTANPPLQFTPNWDRVLTAVDTYVGTYLGSYYASVRRELSLMSLSDEVC